MCVCLRLNTNARKLRDAFMSNNTLIGDVWLGFDRDFGLMGEE